ncbi:MAG TPA: four helix bundle protein [Gemmata sp.]
MYQLAEQLADATRDAALKWDNFARDTVGKQLVRAADRVGANIAEDAGGQNFANNRRLVRIARGSFNEVQHWLRRAFRRNLIDSEQTAQLRTRVEELGPKLNAHLRSISPKIRAAPTNQTSPDTPTPHHASSLTKDQPGQ